MSTSRCMVVPPIRPPEHGLELVQGLDGYRPTFGHPESRDVESSVVIERDASWDPGMGAIALETGGIGVDHGGHPLASPLAEGAGDLERIRAGRHAEQGAPDGEPESKVLRGDKHH